MTCPIVYNCFQQVWELYNVNSILFDDSTPDMARIKLGAEEDQPDMTTLRLRAFYILEVLYSQVIFSAVNHTGVDLGDRFCRQFDRSEEGLTELLEVLDDANKVLRVEAGELELMGREENPGVDLLVGVLNAPRAVVSHSVILATQLKQALRSDHKMVVFGVVFADCLREAGYSFDQCLDYMQTLLSITPHNPLRPWNTTNSFQV